MKLSEQAWMTAEASQYVLKVLAKDGGEARFVGGCVRDALLEREVNDVDIACTHLPEKTMQLLEDAGVKTFPTGIKHGTITAVCDDKEGISRFEITTLRRDEACDGRHAEVAFTDKWEEDAARRDFTMNALYADAHGNITDFYGGVEDAQQGRVRFIGDAKQRIEEDALRILRFFRFFAHYGSLPMDEDGLKACQDMADKIDGLSGERIQTEMLKLLMADHAADILNIMQGRGILQRIGLEASAEAQAALEFLPQMEMDAELSPLALRRLAILTRKMSHPVESAKHIASSWKLSGTKRDALRALVQPSLKGMESWHQLSVKREIRKLGEATFIDLALIGWAEFLVDHADREREAREAFAPMISFSQNWTVPEFPLKGRDLQAIGVPDGKQMGQLLEELEHYWEEKDYYPSREELLKEADKLFNRQLD